MGIQFMQMFYNLTDMFWLGRLGSDAVAAAGAAGMYLWLSNGFLMIGRMGAEIGVSQFLGRGDKKGSLAFSQNSMLIAAILGLSFGLVMIFFNRPMIGYFNFREEKVASEAAAYLFFTGFPMFLNFTGGVAVGSFNASGNSRTPFLLNAVGLAANLTLDPLLIFHYGMGVKGAAIATAISQTISCTALLTALFVSKNRPFERYSFRFSPDPQKIKMIFKWALPISLESLAFCFLSMTTSRIQAFFGAQAIAAKKIGDQIESLSWLISGGFGSAMIAFVGQNYGAKKRQRILRGTKIAAAAMALWGVLVAIVLLFAGANIFALFLPDPALIAMGKRYLFFMAFSQLSVTLEAVAAAAFKGTGRTIPPSIVSISCNAMRPPLAFLLSRTSLGLDGIWIAIMATTIIRGSWICVWYLLSGLRRNLLEDA